MRQGDLFSRDIQGLVTKDEFIDATEEQRLTEHLFALDLTPFRFHGWLGNRKTKTFGWRYDFEDASFTPAEPIPSWLRSLQERAAEFARVRVDEIVHVLLARYDPGAGIGWHRDRPQFQKVVGISLGSSAVMRFRQRTADGFRRSKVELPPRSAYLLSGDSRWEWEHSISPGHQLRFSVTFRTLSERGQELANRGPG